MNMELAADCVPDPCRAFLYRTSSGVARDCTGPLAGLPVAVKDNIHVAGMPLTCGSRILAGYIAPYDATAVARLKQAGAVMIGKTNMDEFAFGSTGEFSAFGPTENPAAPGRVPGGSSSGSAAAVAAGLVPVALGSDTGGSVRQPAACCGVVGLKPGYGRVSRYGLTAFASSMDCIGILGRDVALVGRVFQAVAGKDPMDATSRDIPVEGEMDPDGVPIGIGENWCDMADSDVAEPVRDFLSDAIPLRCRISVRFPDPDRALAVYHILASVEAASNLARFDGWRYGQRRDSGMKDTRAGAFGAEVKRRILVGTWCQCRPDADRVIEVAQRSRWRLAEDLLALLADTPVLVTPVMPQPPAPRNAPSDVVGRYRADLFTVAASLAGLPALSIPIGRDRNGYPVGVQMMAGPGREELLLAVARAMLDRAKRSGV